MSVNFKKYVTYQFPWQFIMLAIFVQSSIGKIGLPDIGIDWFDKILHFFVFGLLGLLTIRGLKNADNFVLRKNYIWISLLTCILFGATDELHQLYVPGRFGTLDDWIADVLGILVFSGTYIFLQKKQIMFKVTRLKDEKY